MSFGGASKGEGEIAGFGIGNVGTVGSSENGSPYSCVHQNIGNTIGRSVEELAMSRLHIFLRAPLTGAGGVWLVVK